VTFELFVCFDGVVVVVVARTNGQLTAAVDPPSSVVQLPPTMFGLHDPLGQGRTSSKHLKDEPLLSHPHHHQIHHINVRNWMQSSIADQPVKSVYMMFTLTSCAKVKQCHIE